MGMKNAVGLLPWQLAKNEEIAILLRPRPGAIQTTTQAYMSTEEAVTDGGPITASQIQG